MSNLDLFRHDFVVSIKPDYATKIVEGSKTVELRRRFPYGTVTGASLYVYASAPIQAVIGFATIQDVERIGISAIWASYNEVAYISRPDFDAYFADLEVGYVIHLTNPVSLERPVQLATLKSALGFTPPQSFTYADEAFKSLIRER